MAQKKVGTPIITIKHQINKTSGTPICPNLGDFESISLAVMQLKVRSGEDITSKR